MAFGVVKVLGEPRPDRSRSCSCSAAAAGTAACWADQALLQTLHEVLQPPSSNLQLTQWSRQPELLQALQVVRQMLQQPLAGEHEQYAAAARLTIQAAYGAVAVSEQAVFAALEALLGAQQQGALPPCLHWPLPLPRGLEHAAVPCGMQQSQPHRGCPLVPVLPLQAWSRRRWCCIAS